MGYLAWQDQSGNPFQKQVIFRGHSPFSYAISRLCSRPSPSRLAPVHPPVDGAWLMQAVAATHRVAVRIIGAPVADRQP